MQRIAVFGFYNSLNAGDDRLQACITRIVRSPTNTVTFFPHQLPPNPRHLREYDWALIGGGGLVFDHSGIWYQAKKWIRKSHCKVGVIGLGINHLPSILRQELDDVVRLASFSFVRDCQSHQMLDNDARVQVAPDLSWTLPYRPADRPESGERIALNLVPCHWRPFDPEAWMRELAGLPTFPVAMYYGPKQDSALLERLFPRQVLPEFEIGQFRDATMVIAARFHAVIFCMQLRIPFIAITYDDKVRRLIDDAALGDCALDTSDHKRIREKVAYLRENRQSVLNRIDHYARSQEVLGSQLALNIRQNMNIDGAIDIPSA